MLFFFFCIARETLSKANTETPRVVSIRTDVEERTNRLAKLVSLDLANPVASKVQVQANIDKLLRLGMGDQVYLVHFSFIVMVV